uniref:Uncharacterized protein n=1 Tax=Kalanchoe fedtschenkoi TaxID=63787 RepID=A0A7N0UKH3_KALFE
MALSVSGVFSATEKPHLKKRKQLFLRGLLSGPRPLFRSVKPRSIITTSSYIDGCFDLIGIGGSS